MKIDFENRVAQSVSSIRAKFNRPITVGIISGTGLGQLSAMLEGPISLDFNSAGFSKSTAPGHDGQIVFGDIAGQTIAFLSGRLHLYEGHAPDEIVLPIYVLRALGASQLILTNSAGALNPDFDPGDIGLITDHINFQSIHALTGPNPDSLGIRFPDMSAPYDLKLRAIASKTARAMGLILRPAIYAAVQGPELETNAERRFLRNAGADLVGMSTAIETVAAIHAGLRVLALSGITNVATGAVDQAPDSIDEILYRAGQIAPRLTQLIQDIISDPDFDI